MDLRQLEILRAIAESGSFTAAGARLHVSQSAISRQVLLLEEEFKEPLFIRYGRRIQITPTGETLLQLSHRVFADIRDTAESILDTKKKLTGTLRLVGGMTVCLYVFPNLLKEFRRQHPDVDIKVITGGTPRLIRQLRSGTADLGLLTLPVDDHALAAEPVIREELLLVTPSGHKLASSKVVSPAALVRQPFILFESGSNTRRVIDEFFARADVKPRVVAETENVEIIKSMVASGLGISIVPFQSVARETRGGSLSVARIQGEDMVRETGWVHLRSERTPRMVREMMDTLTRIMPRLKLSQQPQKRAHAHHAREARVGHEARGPQSHAIASGE
jgi:DNA-binding transcriptional LysR family regulator